ncbi:Ff.00g011530.m01.CDS01 [Fusarium sp. VM40]|nr:Ff.00g011530.m01.CDS01 [Fusarium sp. VM40]
MRPLRTTTAVCFIVILISTFGQATASSVDPKLCGKACRQTFRTLRFADAPKGVFFSVQECTSLLYQTSLHLCWDIHCTKDVWEYESKMMNQTCQDINGSSLPSHDIIDGLTDKDKTRIRHFNATDPDRTSPFDVLMLPSQGYYDLWIRTLDAHDYVWRYHYYYGWAMAVFWAVVVAVGIVNRISPIPGQGPKGLWLKRNVLMPATLGRRCVQDFGGWGTLPPRIQTLTLMAFMLLNVACTLHGYRIFEGMQLLRHVSDRTGIISFANFPLIWLFGMRNNLIIWLTGWEFKTFNNFHRWVGRIAAVQAVIHSIGYTILILQRGGWAYFWRMCNMTYWWTGELATIFLCLLITLSIFWLRRRHYEFFLITHIGLSILILATMLGHVSIFRGDYDPLVWIPVTIWFLDRFIRGARIMAFNPQIWNTSALVTYNEDAHMVRVVVPLRPSMYEIPPGTFYYLMVLNKWNFWESHPFTVASVSGTKRHAVKQLAEESALLGNVPVSSEEAESDSEKDHREMTFLIRPYDSFTSRLRNYAEAEHPKPAILRVAVDGPYGKTLPLERFDEVLFIVGGSGIAVPLSYLQRLLQFTSQPGSVEIHWSVRQTALAVDVLNHELRDVLRDERLKIVIYATGRSDDENSCDLAEWRSERLNVEEAIDRCSAIESEGSLAVVTSGPAKMADESRCAVAARTLHSRPRIEYFEESFQY